LLAIVWIYNLIWFVPLDFIKFGLQAVFNRTLHAVKPFERIHDHVIASKRSKRAIMPSETIDKIIDARRDYSRQLSQQEQQLEVKTTCMPTTFDQMTQTGASFYSPYTDTLSVLKKRNPFLKSVSIN